MRNEEHACTPARHQMFCIACAARAKTARTRASKPRPTLELVGGRAEGGPTGRQAKTKAFGHELLHDACVSRARHQHTIESDCHCCARYAYGDVGSSWLVEVCHNIATARDLVAAALCTNALKTPSPL